MRLSAQAETFRWASTTDPQTCQDMLDMIAGIVQDRVAYIPLCTEPLVLAARDGVELIQRPALWDCGHFSDHSHANDQTRQDTGCDPSTDAWHAIVKFHM